MNGVLLDRNTGRPVVDRDLAAKLEARNQIDILRALERGRAPIYGTEVNPPLYMDVSSAYSGDELGLPWRDVISEGIVAATDLAVTGQAGANSVNIAKGSCWVLGDTNADRQPNYRCFNDAIVNLGINPDPAQPRRVRIVAQITDQGFAGTGRLWALQALHGTPGASPALPAEPASAISLADILVPAAAANSGAYTFTDIRTRSSVGAGQAQLAGATSEYAYTEFTAGVTITGTTEGGATTIVTAPAVVFSGVANVLIEFYAPAFTGLAGGTLTFVLYDGASSIGLLGRYVTQGAGEAGAVKLERRLALPTGTKTYSIRAYGAATGATVQAGGGGTGNFVPGFIRLTRAS